MAKQKTKKCYLKSHFCDSYIAEGQFLAERMCINKARIENIFLSPKFWQNNKPYLTYFKHQIKKANELLAQYPFQVVWDTLDDKRCQKITSLGALFILEPILKEKLLLYNTKMENLSTTEIETSEREQPRKPLGKKSILSQL